MARLLAFSFLVCAAFDFDLPWLDRVGAAALGIAFLAYATPRPRQSLLRRAIGGAAGAIQMPTADAGKTPPSLRARLEPYAVAGAFDGDDRESADEFAREI